MVFRNVFDAEPVSIQAVEIHKHNNYRKVSGDQLAYGETDIEVIAVLQSPFGNFRAGLLIENKVDASQMENQGLRYRARGAYRKGAGDWDDFRCVLLAPNSYLQAQYTGRDTGSDGWDCTVTYEHVVEALVGVSSDDADAKIFLEATATSNSWNKPIPAAVQFWKDYEEFGRAYFPEVRKNRKRFASRRCLAFVLRQCS